MKKVLIITYYWPPAGGPGVQRVLKFSKYLPEFNWQPIILTVKKGEYPATDETLAEDIPECCKVYKTNSIEPNFLYKKFTGMKPDEKIPVAVLAEENLNWKKKLANWVRLNLFIPDAKIGWIPFAIREGKRIIRKENPDIIFSSSPPPTVHLIAKRLAKWSKIKWVADFRDPWAEIHYYENQKRTKISNKLDRKYEKAVLNDAIVITCISQFDIEDDFSKKVKGEKCINIPNGYDESDFTNLTYNTKNDQKFVLMHLGAVSAERNPTNLFRAIRILANEDKISCRTFSLNFIGTLNKSVTISIDEFKINKFVEIMPYLPHRKALEYTQQASVMLLLVTQSEKNKRILPGKTFEYMRTGKPIFVLGPEDGEVSRIISETNTGIVLEYDNYINIYKTLLELFNSWKISDINRYSLNKNILAYSRKGLTEKIVNVFES